MINDTEISPTIEAACGCGGGGNIPILLVPGRKDGADLCPPRNSEYPCGTGLQTAAGRDIDKRWQNRY